MEQVLDSIWGDIENGFVMKNKRKKRERNNISSINTEEHSLEEDNLFSSEKPTKKMKLSYMDKAIEEVEIYRNN